MTTDAAAVRVACINFIEEAFSLKSHSGVIRGRNAAGASFLAGLFRHADTGVFPVLASGTAQAQTFAAVAAHYGRHEPVLVANVSNRGALDAAGVLYHADPALGRLAWQRSMFGHHRWSLCGLTHTLCSVGVLDQLTQLVTAPMQPWDALICTSEAARVVVNQVLDAQERYLRDRFKAVPPPRLQLPVIPLGVHCDDFAFTDAERAAAREQLGIEPDAVVVLYAGRLAFHAKAHPLAMYQAVETAARRCGRKVVLLEAGEHNMPEIGKAYEEAQRFSLDYVRAIHSPGAASADYRRAWAAADIFCSLSDNPQETFGITPVEAMAAGLPVVVSDWDGYRDTVRDGSDGFLVPTLQPKAGLGLDMIERYSQGLISYDMYVGQAASFVAVDIPAASAALEQLIASTELRQRMGASGRERARTHYDWSVIIPRYQQLWQHLNALRRQHDTPAVRANRQWPVRTDPFELFACYATNTLGNDTRLALTNPDAAATLQRLSALRALNMVNYSSGVQATDAELALVFEVAAAGPAAAAELVRNVPEPRRLHALRSLAWLLKLGLLRLV